MASLKATKASGKNRRHARIRAKISGTADRPRLAVSKSNRYMSAQVIDDTKGTTVAAVTTQGLKGKTLKDRVVEAGKQLSEKASKAGVKSVVFDRGGFKYTGNIKAFADTIRESGITF